MTNVLAPLGFTYIRGLTPVGENTEGYPMLYSNTTMIGLGDLVRLNTSGYIVKCLSGEAPMGIFKGWQIRNRAQTGGSLGLGAENSISPWRKAWNGAISLPTNQAVEALVEHDPQASYRVQCMGAVTLASRGLLVDLADAPGGPEMTFGRSRQKVTIPTTYYSTTAIAVDGGSQGSGFTQGGVDLVLDGVIQDLRSTDITVTDGAVTAITVLNPISGHADNTPVISIQAKPGYSGTGSTSFTPTVAGPTTASQFYIDKILEQPFRAVDSTDAGLTTGYDLSNIGDFSWLEVRFAKHQRGGTMYAASAA
jgi:hypothetical protein